jgi:cobalt-zinc-cadmium efflux system membrane fusion protein
MERTVKRTLAARRPKLAAIAVRFKNLAATGAVALSAAAVLVIAAGCERDAREVGAASPATHAHEAHAENDEQRHDETRGDETALSLDELASLRCEHDTPTYQCAECRYEIGVVKLDPGLLKRADGSGLVKIETASRTAVSPVLQATGEVALDENATVRIGPRIAGVVESVKTDVGARVKAGDVLLTLKSVELGNALARYDRDRVLTELAEKTFQREKSLWEEKVCSEQDVIAARMTYEEHRAELNASAEALRVLGLTEDDLEALRRGPERRGAGSLPVRAPIAGTIIEKRAVAGETVEPGTDLMVLADLSTIWVWASVHAHDLADLIEAEKRGPVAVEIAVAAFPGRRFEGVLTYVGATMSEETRTVKVRATVENPDRALRPGMFCDAAIRLGEGEGEDVLAVPRDAVLSDEGEDFVFKLWKDDFFVRQDVRTGREFHGMVELLDGLRPGETFVAEGAFLLKSDVLREKMGAGCAD